MLVIEYFDNQSLKVTSHGQKYLLIEFGLLGLQSPGSYLPGRQRNAHEDAAVVREI
jgi:hypothetical protein